MSFACRVSFYLLLLSLNLVNPPYSPSQSLVSTPSPLRSSDEETLRRMTEQYGLAMEAGDLEAMSRLGSPQSAALPARLRHYQGVFSNARVRFLRMNVILMAVTGERAVTHLSTDERYLDKKTGAALLERDAIHGTCRSLEWVKTGAEWKLEREFLIQDELAAKLEAAATDQERDGLLEKEKAFVNESLVSTFTTRSGRFRVRGEFEAALRCNELWLEVAEKIGDKAGIAGATLELGMLKVSMDEQEQGLPILRKALALYEAAGLTRGVALTLEKLSRTYRLLGDQQQSFECAEKSLRIYEPTNNRMRIVDALAEMGYVYQAQNNFQLSLAYLEKALPIAQELGEPIQIAILRHDIANQYLDLGNYDRALEAYKELLKQTEGFGDRGGAGMIRGQIGKVFAAQGRYAEALEYFQQALTAHEAGNQKHATIVGLLDISGVYLTQGKYGEALPLLERSVSLARQTREQLDLWLSLTSRGYSQTGLNRPLEARQSFAEAVSIVERLRTQTAGGVEERERYFEGGLRAHHGLLSLLVNENQAREALVFAERTKARALLDILRQGRVSVRKAMTAEEQEQERRLKSELTQLNRRLARATESDERDSGSIGEIEPRLEKARLNYEAFQNSLYAAHPELKVQRGEAPIISSEEMTSLLPWPASALLEYVVTDDKIYLFVVTKAEKAEADVRAYTLGVKREELGRLTEAFRRQLARRDLGFRAAAAELYELLLKPAEEQLKGKTDLIISPDDTLWDLPFQALLTRPDRFLIQDAAIAYAPSLTVLREMTRRRRNQSGDGGSATLLALGNPMLGKEIINRATPVPRGDKLDPLPEAEQEVKALRRLYGTSKSRVYIGAQAREELVKREAGHARILHFATHGTLNNASPMYSYLALAQGGVNEDGLLEAWELMQLDLKADLAVLSACETARGRFGAGEGMIGLSWAMFIAGVPATVVSQWKVESAGTRDLMVNFHRGLISQPAPGRAKPTKSEALRQAALKLMKNPETRHPFYWAGFVLVGDGR